MIPLYKLEKLPRTQRLRKIAKFFTFAENRLSLIDGKKSREKTELSDKVELFSIAELFSVAELGFFKEAAELLAGDGLFSPDAGKALREASDVFTAAVLSGEISSAPEFRRAINCVKHILLAETGRDQADWDFTVSGGLDPAKRQIFEGMMVYMEDIRSPFNVGAMFRTAESFGVEKIILSPLCADPRHKRAQRTAMGCTEIIPWERQDLFPASEPPPPCPVFALETGGIPLADFPFPRKGLLIAGSEELGVSPRALAAADASLGRVSIPSYGAKASLNVSVAFGIAVNAWADKILDNE
jgi:TrmH family RNA methyltransferase